MPEAVDHPVFALNPFVVVGSGAGEGAVKELLPVAANIYSDGFVLAGRHLRYFQAQFESDFVSKLAKLDGFFFIFESFE
jgi:hypothetical protein